jgi:hypothetical protein
MYGYNIMESDSSSSMNPAVVGGLLYAAVMAGMSFANGVPVDIMGVAVDGGLMAASLLANEMVHKALDTPPTQVSSAAATAAAFAGLQSVVKGNQNIAMNAAAGAGTDFALGIVYSMGKSE